MSNLSGLQIDIDRDGFVSGLISYFASNGIDINAESNFEIMITKDGKEVLSGVPIPLTENEQDMVANGASVLGYKVDFDGLADAGLITSLLLMSVVNMIANQMAGNVKAFYENLPEEVRDQADEAIAEVTERLAEMHAKQAEGKTKH